MASRTLALGGCGSARFWFSAFFVAVMPTSIGYADVAALLARQPATSLHSSHEHLIASPFGPIEPATFSYGFHPIGTSMPRPPAIELVNFDPRSLDAKAWTIDQPFEATPAAQIAYPTVDRRLKGDRMPSSNSAPATVDPKSLPQLQPIDAAPATRPLQPSPSKPVAPPPRSPHAQAPAAPIADASGPVSAVAPASALATPALLARRADASDIADLPPEVPASGQIGSLDGQSATLAAIAFADRDAEEAGAQSYFGSGVLDTPSGLQSWAPGAEPLLVTPTVDGADGDMAIGKDESRLESPAQRLGLAGKARAKAERCLADAVYFEARGEPLRGQEAVAQVVMNRVFSGYYPNNVCGVVYQNASHYLACQFTFACEHKDLNRIDEPDMWVQAKRIAKDTLDGKIWLTDIGHATHYHAYWVHPSWVHEMTRLYKLGVHTFYRPRAWGKGDDEPVWGAPPNTSKADPKPDAAAKGPEAEAAPAAAKTAKL
jgi:hypothetical protein